MSSDNKHPYHLVDPSPWPLVTSMACFNGIKAIMAMNDEGSLLFFIGAGAVTLASILWWEGRCK